MTEREALKQEPVARVQFDGGLWKVTLLTAVKKLERSSIHALYTTSPPRTWVGLTEDEREELMDTYDVASTDYAHAIETKLKEKNT